MQRLQIRGQYIPPAERKALHNAVRALAGNRCIRCGHPDDAPAMRADPLNNREHNPDARTPCDDRCTHDRDGKMRILTVHHLTGDKSNNLWWNLLALCQICHLVVQAKVIPERPWLFDHSPWFVPYVCGFYAAYYADTPISREEADADPERWLALNPAKASS